jgi:hypothetical protein
MSKNKKSTPSAEEVLAEMYNNNYAFCFRFSDEIICVEDDLFDDQEDDVFLIEGRCVDVTIEKAEIEKALIYITKSDWIYLFNQYSEQKKEMYKQLQVFCGTEYVALQEFTFLTVGGLEQSDMPVDVTVPTVFANVCEIQMEKGFEENIGENAMMVQHTGLLNMNQGQVALETLEVAVDIDEEVIIAFDIEESILTYDLKGNIHIRGIYGSFYLGDNSEECVLMIPKKLWTKLHNKYLKHKQDYYKLWKGEYCGVNHCTVRESKIVGEANLLSEKATDENETKHIYNKVKMIQVMDADIEVEHG